MRNKNIPIENLFISLMNGDINEFSESLAAYLTIVRKEVIRILRISLQTILPPIITASLYFIIFGSLIGSQIQNIKGFSFMQFITPGLVMMSMITNSYMNVCSSFFSIKFQRSIEELIVSPCLIM